MVVVHVILAGNNRNPGILKISTIQIPALLQVYEANAGTIATCEAPGVSSVDTIRCCIFIALQRIERIVYRANWRRSRSHHIGSFDVINFSQGVDQFVSVHSRRRFDLEPGREVRRLIIRIIFKCAIDQFTETVRIQRFKKGQ